MAKHGSLRSGTIKRIHVDKHVIVRNLKTGERKSPITIQTSRGSLKVKHAQILGGSEMVYSPDKPLSCGARVYLVTIAQVDYVE